LNLNYPKLFEKGQIGSLSLANRIIKAPMHNYLPSSDGAVTERLIQHYEEQARGGTALVIVQYSQVSNREQAGKLLGINDDRQIPGLAALSQAIQDNGARAGIQLAHIGPHTGAPLVKCVSIKMPQAELDLIKMMGGGELQEYTLDEIEELIASYGEAAARAQKAGFDMIEVHAAHQHGAAQFLSPRTNQRTDRYGGSAENRRRFLLEIIAEIRVKIGRDYPLSVRFSGSEYYPDGLMIEESTELAKSLEKATVDIVHVSGGAAFGPNGHYTVSPMSLPRGLHLWAAAAVKKAVTIPVIATGSITTPEMAEEILEQGKGDFISLARPLVADPQWPRKAKEGRTADIRPCIRCNDGCVDRSDMLGRPPKCTVNVTASREAKLPITRTASSKRVAIVGGGPAGLEAAMVCALRGHQVTLYEKRKLGGSLIEASIPEFKADLRRLIAYYTAQITKLPVNIVYQEARLSTITEAQYEAVIVAAGAEPIKWEFPGADLPLVSEALTVLTQFENKGQKICVVGGGLIGIEVALFLARQGKEVIITTRQDKLLRNLVLFDQLAYQDMLEKYRVTVYSGRHIERATENGIIITDNQGRPDEIQVDQVVLASGFTPRTALWKDLEKEPGLEVYAAGDCVNPRRIFDAIHEGHMAAQRI
jgi:2,4-dienoyl-CoA reductase-like NADH-dependent reductase (Old Yellow Enzyme family)/thioredoxin reductase